MTALVVAANIARRNSTVRGIQVEVDYSGCDTLVSPQKIERSIIAANPSLTSLQVKQVDTKNIRQQVMASPYVAECQTYVSILGNVVVKATQRKPLLHVYCQGKEFYIDNTGQKVPLSPEGKAHAMVANGHFEQAGTALDTLANISTWENDSLLCNHGLTRAWRLAHFLDEEDYAALFDQIYVEAQGDLLLTPKLGNHIVNIGDPDDLEEKLDHLMALYQQALPRMGWERYRTISLKYKGQVVCQKRA